MSLLRGLRATGILCAVVAAGLLPGTRSGGLAGSQVAQAQNLGRRSISGTVVDGNSTPVPGATVFLKDLKTKSIRSFTTTEKGRFEFAGSLMYEDQELWAEKDGKKTPVKTVSSWDTRTLFETELKLK